MVVQLWCRISRDWTQTQWLWQRCSAEADFHWKEQKTKNKTQAACFRWVCVEWRVTGGFVSRRLELMYISYLSCRACSTHSNRLLQQEDLVFIWLVAWMARHNGREGTGGPLDSHRPRPKKITASIQGCFNLSIRPPLTKTSSRKPFSHLLSFGIQYLTINCWVSDDKLINIHGNNIIYIYLWWGAAIFPCLASQSSAEHWEKIQQTRHPQCRRSC